jgi:hypothetical protein
LPTNLQDGDITTINNSLTPKEALVSVSDNSYEIVYSKAYIVAKTITINAYVKLKAITQYTNKSIIYIGYSETLPISIKENIYYVEYVETMNGIKGLLSIKTENAISFNPQSGNVVYGDTLSFQITGVLN